MWKNATANDNNNTKGVQVLFCIRRTRMLFFGRPACLRTIWKYTNNGNKQQQNSNKQIDQTYPYCNIADRPKNKWRILLKLNDVYKLSRMEF